MKLLFIRHGDPDYEKDSLTEKGWHEAELLGQRMANTPVTAFYVSPLGRAKDTASKTLQKVGRDATELAWLREFHAPIPDFHRRTKNCLGSAPGRLDRRAEVLRQDTLVGNPAHAAGSRDRRGKACLERSGRDPDTARL